MNLTLYYLAQTLAEVPEDDDWLGKAELQRTPAIRFTKRRNEWRLGRWTAKQAICAFLPETACPLSSLEILAADDGAPEAFIEGKPAQVSISISHSHGVSLCVAGPADMAVGCDIELVEPREDSIVEDYFTNEEKSFIESVQKQNRNMAITLIWSAKESILKALRQGLRRDTRSVQAEVQFDACEDAWKPWNGRCFESSRNFHGWWRFHNGYIYTAGANHSIDAPLELHS